MTPAVIARGIGVRVGAKTLLHGVELELLPGRITAIVGVNGAGKSTLLRVLAGELRPHTGTVMLAGKAQSQWEPRALARTRAVMTQHCDVAFPFTVDEVVALGRYPHPGYGNSYEDRRIVQAALAYVDASHLAGRRYPTLSGGERQRVQLARTLAQVWQPTGQRIVLLDEPTASLDLAQVHRTLAQVQRFAREGTCILLIVHDLNAAARFADEVVILRQGQVFATGSPIDVLSQQNVTAAFGSGLGVFQHPEGHWPVVLPHTPHESTTDSQLQPLTTRPGVRI
ncbi:MAG: heme ABC transporter ATP-binding protein [Nannocystaceae bacterium]